MNIVKILTPFNRDVRAGREILYLVFHYTGTLAPAVNNAKYYAGQHVGASAHYYLDEGPVIYQGVEDKDVAWHCGDKTYVHPECRNANSIGIEMVPRKVAKGQMSATETDWYFEPETIDNAVALGRALMARYGIPVQNVLRHYDVTGKYCPNPFMVDDKAKAVWEGFKRRLAEPEGDPPEGGTPPSGGANSEHSGEFPQGGFIPTEDVRSEGPPCGLTHGEKGGIDLTKEEIVALVVETVEVMQAKTYYNTVDELPEWGRPTVQRLIGAGALKGNEHGLLSLSEDLLRALVIMERGSVSIGAPPKFLRSAVGQAGWDIRIPGAPRSRHHARLRGERRRNGVSELSAFPQPEASDTQFATTTLSQRRRRKNYRRSARSMRA